MNRKEKVELLKLLEEKEKRKKYNKLFSYFPDEGPLRRELYQKHLEFFRAGKDYHQRLALAANRVGKTEGMGGYEFTLHLTGLYPDWWEGKRFDRPVHTWTAGDSAKTVRDVIQFKLLGPISDIGSGLIPKDCIIDSTPKHGTPEAIDSLYVRHVSGGISTVQFKSYDQKRKAFQGTKKDIIWLDEEPPQDVYDECLLRTMDTSGGDGSNRGMAMLTFTPLSGMSDVVLSFLPGGELPEEPEDFKYVVMAEWDDVPHLSAEEKRMMLASIPPHQRDARSKGIPALGSGAIFPVPETDVFVDDFELPKHWPKAFAMDVGWNRTAALWGAHDREADCLYVFSEHYRGQAEPSIHAQSIKARGDWIPGVSDPAARGRSQKDGAQLFEDYRNLGLDLETAFNGVESGLLEVWQRMSTGRLKIFNSCVNTKAEFRLYRRDEKGRIVKEKDHLMDTLRYLVMSGISRAITEPFDQPEDYDPFGNLDYSGGSWMG